MRAFCQNPYCQNPGAKVVPVAVEKPSDEHRTLCAVCEEAYSWGVQQGTKSARAKAALPVNRRELATILAALRFHRDENLQGTRAISAPLIRKIATKDGRWRPLNFEEVSQLSQRLRRVQTYAKEPPS